MSHMFGKPIHIKAPGIRTYQQLKLMGAVKRVRFPYPMMDPVNQPHNNPLHQAILENNVDALDSILSEEALDKKQYSLLLRQKSLRNSPVMLAIKLGRWEMVSKLMRQAEALKLPSYDIEDIFSARDSMGLTILSYAVLLRAPETLIQDCLKYTRKYFFLCDENYKDYVSGASQMAGADEPLYEVTDKGYINRKDIGRVEAGQERGFEIYSLSLKALYKKALPESIKASDDIEDHTDFFLLDDVSGQKKKATPFHQYLRNIVFHLPDLCESEGEAAIPHPPSFVSSIQQFAFDVRDNYPIWAKARNARYEARIEKLIASWESMSIYDEEWVPPTEEVLDAQEDEQDHPRGGAAEP